MEIHPTTIHLGLAKTATTTFQTHLFANHSQIHYFGKFTPGGLPAPVRPALLTKVCKTYPLDPGDIRASDIPTQLEYAAQNGLAPVFSEEGLSAGWRLKKLAQALWIKTLFGNCNIIFFVREPVSFIQSYYTQILKDFHRKQQMREGWAEQLGPAPRYFDINEWLDASWRSLNPPSQFLRYADTARIYAKIFGKQNMRIYVFEEFVRNPEHFIRRLCCDLGIDPNEGCRLIDGKRANDGIPTGYIDRLQEIETSPKLNDRFRAAAPKERRKMLDHETLPGDKFRPELSDKWLEIITGFGQKQNRRLAAGWDLPLTNYGYHL